MSLFPSYKHPGLDNFSNNCYLNSLLQCLVNNISITQIMNDNNEYDIMVFSVIKKYELLGKSYDEIVELSDKLIKEIDDKLEKENVENKRIYEFERFIINKVKNFTYEVYIYLEWKIIYNSIFKNAKVIVDIRNFVKLLSDKASTTAFNHLFSGAQNDPHECLIYMFDLFNRYSGRELSDVDIKKVMPKLDTELISVDLISFYEKQFINYNKKQYSLFNKHFDSSYMNIIECSGCHHVSYNISPVSILEIPINKEAADGRSKEVSLVDCLQKYFTSESITDVCTCEHCKQPHTRSITNKLLTLPNCLIMELKRFERLPNGRLVKVSNPINSPAQIDMSPYLFKNAGTMKYQLTGVINHIGNLNFGHYYSYNRKIDLATNKVVWLKCDDTRIELIPEEIAYNHTDAYILFYQKID